MAYLEEHTCIRFIKWTTDMPPKPKMTFEANFDQGFWGYCSTYWSTADGRIVYFFIPIIT